MHLKAVTRLVLVLSLMAASFAVVLFAYGPRAASADDPTTLTVQDFAFSSANLTATSGQPITIAITNNGPSTHTFMIDGLTDSGNISPNSTNTVTFTPSQPGTYTFYCAIHGADLMKGTLTVQ